MATKNSVKSIVRKSKRGASKNSKTNQVELEMQNEELRRAQTEIEESRSNYVDLYDFAPVGYFTLNGVGKIVEVNLTGARLLDIERSQLVGRLFSTFVAPDFRSTFRDHCQELQRLREGEKKGCELELIKKDGTSFYASLESVSAPDPGKDFRTRSALIDISEQRRAREKIHKLNQEIDQRAMDLDKVNRELEAEIAIRKQTEEDLRKLTHDLNKRIQEINCLYSACYQVERQSIQLEERIQDIVGILPSGWQYPEIASARITLDQKEYRTDNFRETPWKQVSEIIVDDTKIGRVEICYLEEKPMAHEGPFLKEERGLIDTIAIEIGEMVGHARADRALRDASLYARTLIEASLDPMVTIDRDGKIMDVNKATELVTGVTRETLIGSDFADYFTEPEKARKGYRQVFYNGFVRDYPLAIRHTTGHVTDVLYIATLYRNESGEIQGVFAAARDVTDRKRMEETLRESERRLRMLSSELLLMQENERRRIALEVHDSLGQFLNAIKFKVESTLHEMEKRNDPSTRSIKELIPVIQESIDEARRLQMDLSPPMLDDLGIMATFSWFCRQFQKTYADIQIEIQTNIDEDAVPKPLNIVIYRILQEGMNNIAKHSKASLVTLSLKKEDGRIALIIQDNGQGFDLSGKASAEERDRGLGLTSMRERTKLSGGAFSIESVKNKGTTIQVSWPV